MAKAKSGALVQYCGHNGVFVADIYEVGGANVVRPLGPVHLGKLDRSAQALANATHHLVDFPQAGFWRPDLGIFVVPSGQVTELK